MLGKSNGRCRDALLGPDRARSSGVHAHPAQGGIIVVRAMVASCTGTPAVTRAHGAGAAIAFGDFHIISADKIAFTTETSI